MQHYKKYLNKKYAVHCPTQKNWDEVIGVLIKEKITNEYYNIWPEYKTTTCLSVLEDGFCYKEWFKREDYKILTVDEFFGREAKINTFLKDWENGEIIGNYYPALNKTMADYYSKIQEKSEKDSDCYLTRNIEIQPVMFNIQETINKIQKYQQDNFINKPNIIKKSMSIIKNTFKSKENKAMEHFDLGTAYELNENGRNEWVDFVFATGKTDRDLFLTAIVERYKKETK